MSSDGVGDDGSHAEFHSGKHTEDVSEGNVDKKNRERNVSDNLHGNNSAYPLNSRKKEEMKRRTHELERSHSDDKHGEFEKGQPWLDITVERNLNSRGREGKATHGEAHARPSRQPGQVSNIIFNCHRVQLILPLEQHCHIRVGSQWFWTKQIIVVLSINYFPFCNCSVRRYNSNGCGADVLPYL